MLNETFNNIPEEKEISDEDTIVYTSGSNGKPLLALIEKQFDLNQVIKKLCFILFFIFAKEGNLLSRHSVI